MINQNPVLSTIFPKIIGNPAGILTPFLLFLCLTGLTLPPSGKIEISAMAQDGSGHSSTFLGREEVVPAAVVPKPIEQRKEMLYRLENGVE